MQINNGNTSTVKSLVTETADVQSLLHARVNGNGDVVEEPAVTFVAKRYTNGCAKPRHTHTGPQIVDDVRLAVLRAESAVYLIDTLHITVAEAAKRTNSNAAYIGAWRLLQQSGDVQLMEDVRAGCISLLAAAKLVKPLVEMKAAFEAAKAVNPVGIIDFFKTAEVKSFATAAEVGDRGGASQGGSRRTRHLRDVRLPRGHGGERTTARGAGLPQSQHRRRHLVGLDCVIAADAPAANAAGSVLPNRRTRRFRKTDKKNQGRQREYPRAPASRKSTTL